MAYGVVAYHVPLPGYELHAADFACMAGNGLGWVEMDYAWRLIEPQPGVFDFSYYDAITQAARAHGLHILAKLGNGYNGNRATVPDWTVNLSPAAYLQALEGYGRAVLERYAHAIAAYALENEANIAAMHTRLGWRVGEWPQERVMAIWKSLGDLVRRFAPQSPPFCFLWPTQALWRPFCPSAVSRTVRPGLRLRQMPTCPMTRWACRPTCAGFFPSRTVTRQPQHRSSALPS